MFRFIIAFLLFFLVSTSSNAVPGCVNGARNAIHTSLHPSGKYWQNSSTSSSPGCLYFYTGGICSIGSQNANNGMLGDTANPQECPIDDYIWIMMILLGALGFYFIRQKNVHLAVIS